MVPLPWFIEPLLQWNVVLVGLVVYIVIQYILFVGLLRSRKNPPPGVHGYPLVGILPTIAFGNRPINEVINEYTAKHGQVFRLAMGLQEVYVVNGAEAVRKALRTPALVGWPIHARRKVGEGRIHWERIEKDIRTALTVKCEPDVVGGCVASDCPCSSGGLRTPQMYTLRDESDVPGVLNTTATLVKVCTSMKSGIADCFELVTKDIGELVMPVCEDTLRLQNTRTSNQFHDDLAEVTALSFFKQGKPDEVVRVIKDLLLSQDGSNGLDSTAVRASIKKELGALKEPPSWEMGQCLPQLMGLIAYGYRVAHRQHFLIRRCTSEVGLQNYLIPKDAVLVLCLAALTPPEVNQPAANNVASTPDAGLNDQADPTSSSTCPLQEQILSTEDSWPFELGNHLCPSEMTGLLYVFHSTVNLVEQYE